MPRVGGTAAHADCFDLVVSELLDTTLIGEGVVPTLRDVYARRLLVPSKSRDIVSVPAGARLIGQAFHGPAVWEGYRWTGQGAPFNHHEEAQVEGSGRLVELHDDALWACEGITDAKCLPCAAATHTALDRPRHCSEPFVVFALDFNDVATLTPRATTTVEVPLTIGGPEQLVHGVHLWWELDVGQPGAAEYSSAGAAAATQGYQDHWKQSLWLLPDPLTATSASILVTCQREDTGFQLVVEAARKATSGLDAPMKQQQRTADSRQHQRHDRRLQGHADGGLVESGTAPCPSQALYTLDLGPGWAALFDDQRKQTMADRGRTDTYASALCAIITAAESVGGTTGGEAVEGACNLSRVAPGVPSPITVLDICEGSFAGLLCCSLGGATPSCTVISLEDKPRFRGLLSAAVAQNGLQTQLTVWGGAEAGEPWNGNWPQPDVVVGDCFYSQLVTKPVWGPLNFWVLRSAMHPVLAPDVTVMPHCCRVMGALVSMTDLWKCHQRIDRIAGFDHTRLVVMQDGPQDWHPVSMWQFRHTLLTEPVCLLTLETSRSLHAVRAEVLAETGSYVINSHVDVGITVDADAHAVVVWTDLFLDAAGKWVVPGFRPGSALPAAGRQYLMWLTDMPRTVVAATASGVRPVSSAVPMSRLRAAIQLNLDEASIAMDFSLG